jgi:hypothetical protein
MHTIIDAAVDLTRHAEALARSGIQTVIRYYCRSSSWPGKCLSRTEADALIGAGLTIGTVFQQRGGAGGHIEDLDAESGKRDAESSLELAGRVGQPTGSAIFFAVDHDFHEPADLASIAAYFDAVRAVIDGRYRVGCYGSGLVHIHAGAELKWLANARAWQGTVQALAARAYDLRQHLPQDHPLGFPYDPNEAPRADFGQWPAVAAPVKPAPAPEPAPTPSRDQVRAIQRACEAAGISPGPIDGIVGPLTRAAVAALRALLGDAGL